MNRALVGSAAAAVMMVLLAPGAQAAFYTGKQLLDFCESSSEPLRTHCLGYIMAIGDVIEDNAIDGWRSCSPRGLTGVQMRDIAVAFLKKNPRSLGDQAVGLVAHAFTEAYPCR